MTLTQQQRQAIITELTTNGSAWTPADRELMASFTDEKLLQLKRARDTELKAIAVANSAIEGFSSGNEHFRLNPETGTWQRKELAKNAKMKDDDDDDDDDDEGEEEISENTGHWRKESGGKRNEGSSKRTQTPEELLRQLPPEYRQRLQSAEQIVNERKEDIINRLLVNVNPAVRKAHRERLLQRELPDLENDLALLPQQPANEDVARSSLSQNHEAPTRRRGSEDMLALPSVDFNAKDPNEAARYPEVVANEDSPTDNGDIQLDEWMRKAPPQIRQTVNKAIAIEAQQRRELVAQLTANLEGAAVKKAVKALERLDIEELRAMVDAYGRGDSNGRRNYFGTSTPAGVTNRESTGSDDVLPLPKMDYRDIQKQA